MITIHGIQKNKMNTLEKANIKRKKRLNVLKLEKYIKLSRRLPKILGLIAVELFLRLRAGIKHQVDITGNM